MLTLFAYFFLIPLADSFKQIKCHELKPDVICICSVLYLSNTGKEILRKKDWDYGWNLTFIISLTSNEQATKLLSIEDSKDWRFGAKVSDWDLLIKIAAEWLRLIINCIT